MKRIGSLIAEARKSKGLTQEELAEQANVNLRTIQRIESDENNPRNSTLKLICSALDIDESDFHKEEYRWGSLILNGTFLILVNLLLMLVIGFMTLDSKANFNSRVGAALLSILIPLFIVYVTPKLSGAERVFRYGTGFIIYIILLIAIQGFPKGMYAGFYTWLFPCLVISIALLNYGHLMINRKDLK